MLCLYPKSTFTLGFFYERESSRLSVILIISKNLNISYKNEISSQSEPILLIQWEMQMCTEKKWGLTVHAILLTVFHVIFKNYPFKVGITTSTLKMKKVQGIWENHLNN